MAYRGLIRGVLLLATVGAAPVWAAALEALDDTALSAVTGREGIAMDYELRTNADANGVALTAFNNCKNTNLCSIAIQFNNRGGNWFTVYKDTFGSMTMTDLQIDGAFSQASASVYANDSRFWNDAGTVCMPSGGAAAGCAAQLLDKPLIAFAYKNATNGQPGVNKRYTAFETDVAYHLHLGRVAVESNFDKDERGSFIGLLVSDSTQLRAKIDVDGRVFMSGF